VAAAELIARTSPRPPDTLVSTGVRVRVRTDLTDEQRARIERLLAETGFA
jgi:hypothetical protein